jgi:outer membrane protein OmpA-like peptidoglycan-associated protein
MFLAMALGAGPAAAEVHTIKVYFDWNAREPTAATRNLPGIWAEQALICRQGVKITGHADRSQTDQRSHELSVLRASWVRSELISNGVSPSSITVEARGESQPAVQTEDGVREPMNRRVEIVIACA